MNILFRYIIIRVKNYTGTYNILCATSNSTNTRILVLTLLIIVCGNKMCPVQINKSNSKIVMLSDYNDSSIAIR